MEAVDFIGLPACTDSGCENEKDQDKAHETSKGDSQRVTSQDEEDKLDNEKMGQKSDAQFEDGRFMPEENLQTHLVDNDSDMEIEDISFIPALSNSRCGIEENGIHDSTHGTVHTEYQPSVHPEKGSLAVQDENHLIGTHRMGGSSISGVKRKRGTFDEQQPSICVAYNSLSRASKHKLEELLRQWSEWHAKQDFSSQDPTEVLESGEETIFPALHVGLKKTSALSFWIDNQIKKPQNDEFIPLDGNFVPLYDRGFALGLTSGGASSNVEGGLEIIDDANRCFNCGSYSHALKTCPKPRDSIAVNNARKQLKSKRNQNAGSRNATRYYQNSPAGKYDGLRPGALDSETRKLLGIGELDPPPWLNRMREIGYPPGYLDPDEVDRPSGITIFDDEEIKEQEDGEIIEQEHPESPQRKMTVEFPGVNAPIPANANEERWAAATLYSDTYRSQSHHRLNHTSESVSSRGHHHIEQRWHRDSRDDGPPGVEPGYSTPTSSYPRYGSYDISYNSHSQRGNISISRSPPAGRDRGRRSTLADDGYLNYGHHSSSSRYENRNDGSKYDYDLDYSPRSRDMWDSNEVCMEEFMSKQMSEQMPNYNVMNPPSAFQAGENGLGHQFAKSQACYLWDWHKDPGVIYTRSWMKIRIADVLSVRTRSQGGQWPSKLVTILENLLFEGAASEEEYVNQETLYNRLHVAIPLAVDAHFRQQEIEKVCNEISLGEMSTNSMYSMGDQFSRNEATNYAQFMHREDLNYTFDALFEYPVQNQRHDQGAFEGCWGNFQNVQSVLPSTLGREPVLSCSSLLIPKDNPTVCNDKCLTDYCISGSVNQLNAANKLQPNLKSATAYLNHFGFGDYYDFSSEDVLTCTKRLKMENSVYPSCGNENFHLPSPLMVQPCLSERLPPLQQQPQSPFNSEVLQKLNYESLTTPCSLNNGWQPEESDLTSLTESINTGDNVEAFSDNTGRTRTDFVQTEPELESNGTKPGTPKINGVSVTEFFTEDQIKEHMPSLEVGKASTLKLCSVIAPSVEHTNSYQSEETCQICLTDSINSISYLCENENFGLSDPLMVQPSPSEGFPFLQQQPQSPISVNSEVLQKLNYEIVTTPSAITISQQAEGTDLTSITDSINSGDNMEVISDGMGFNGVDHIDKEVHIATDFIQKEPELEAKGTKPVTKVVSLTDFFTADQIKEHISSFGIGQDSLEGETLKMQKGKSENICKMCALDKLFLAPEPMYCACCGARIRQKVNYYYCAPDENGTRYCFCTTCYNVSRRGNISFRGICIPKSKLYKLKNDAEIEESWVQCDKCEGWQHQICALFNDKSDPEGQVDYICPKCCLKEIESGDSTPLSKNDVFSAKDLPKTMLSNHIEQRLFRNLKQEKVERAKATGKSFNEVPGAEDLVVRIVLSVEKQLEVKKKFRDIFKDESYPAEFPYRSKVILLFQKIEGVDVCIFGIYVQEFGSECSPPNQRCVYISYLDSIKYFRPEVKTVTGEPLRTFVYHEILIGYLDYVKRQGFATCYIWASPPSKGEDYIFYCHPQVQRTPKSDKLRHWYKSMLRKAANEKIVVNCTNLHDQYFIPSEQSSCKITAARVPYFDGDYWSGAVEGVLMNIEEEISKDSQLAMKKLVTNRTLKAMGCKNPSDESTKDILLMQKMSQKIFHVKEDFMVICFQFTCTSCHELILSGKWWSCSQCKNFHLCERCHDEEQSPFSSNKHALMKGKQHFLYQVIADKVHCDTKDEDVILDNDLFLDRHSFLDFCQKNRYQFDTLRRAKHSSMMVLHHLRNLTVTTLRMTCSICHKKAVVDPSWICELCLEFDVCAACYQEKGRSCHIHNLTRYSSTPTHWIERKEAQQDALLVRELVDVIQHASKCHEIKACSYPNCHQMKLLFHHAAKCTVRAAGGCSQCKKAWLGLSSHSRRCGEAHCTVPRCMDLRKHAKTTGVTILKPIK
ncbi:hypothetical protein FNV43_RR13613 [Rhamnella rubrinervis]|uniref:histone acetyltransferase n=1 Tax=Rhamnella rubrinervis TaxID=2594499 RepID=A0A8K0H1N6_9ROSA|nr:hypothetical protein FNV43_RR13613 [Rhamnella rubrinervis]